MEIAGNSNAETSTAFLQQLRENHPGPLVVIWGNGPAHRGEAIRSYLATPDLHLRLVALPAYSPDFEQAVANSRTLFEAAARAGIGRIVHFSVANNSTYILNEPRVGYRMPKGETQELEKASQS